MKKCPDVRPGHDCFAVSKNGKGECWRVPTPTEHATLDAIQDFLSQKRIAIVGMSRDEKSLSAMLFKELDRRGYDLIPVNPNVRQVMGHTCFSRLQEVKPPVEAALLMTSPQVTETVVTDCLASGIKRVWMHRAGGQGAVSDKAIAFCRQHGICVIPGECPFMFLPKIGGIHALHGLFRKLTRRYPRHSHA